MRLYFLTKKSLKASSHDSKLGFEEGSYSVTLLLVVVRAATAGKAPEGLGLAWILQDRKRRRQWRHADDVTATVISICHVIVIIININSY